MIQIYIVCCFLLYYGLVLAQLPPQCNEYLILDDLTRNINHGNNNEFYCDNVDNFWITSPDWQNGDNWYRMMPPAGMKQNKVKM